MNIHTRYHFSERIVSDNMLKVLGIHAEDFYFLVLDQNSPHLALSGTLKGGFEYNNWIQLIQQDAKGFDPKPDQIFLMPDDMVAVPVIMAKQHTEEELFSSVQILPETHQLLKSEVPSCDLFILSALRSGLLKEARSIVDHQHLFDMAAVWLKKISLVKGNRVHVLVLNDRFLLAAFNEDKLVLFNQFDFQGKSDFLYFLLGAVSSTGLNPSAVSLHLCGMVSPSSPMAQGLEAYFTTIVYDAAPVTVPAEQAMIGSMMYPLFPA